MLKEYCQNWKLLVFSLMLFSHSAIAESRTGYGMLSSVNSETLEIEINGYHYRYNSQSKFESKRGGDIKIEELNIFSGKMTPVRYEVKKLSDGSELLINTVVMSWKAFNQEN